MLGVLGRALSLAVALALAACANPPPSSPPGGFSVAALNSLLPQDAILLGEQHDAAEHQLIHHEVVVALLARNALTALVIEMAGRGNTTAGLARDAGEQQVRQRLAWDEQAWDWSRYGPAIMAAVRAGIVVAGGNLPREAMRQAMADTSLDRRLSPAALARQQQAIRHGHCDLLPPGQIQPMTRIQIARDASMAATVQQFAVAGKVVLLLAGAAHVERSTGVPAYWPADFRSASIRLRPSGDAASGDEGRYDQQWSTAAVQRQDHCAELGKRLPPRPNPP